MKFSIQRVKIFLVIKNKEPISVSKLADEVSLSKGNTIYRYLRELEEKGFIKIVKKKEQGQPAMVSTTGKGNPFSKRDIELIEKVFKIE